MTKLFFEVPFRDERMARLNGTNRAGRRPHSLAEADVYRGQRVAANDNIEREKDEVA